MRQSAVSFLRDTAYPLLGVVVRAGKFSTQQRFNHVQLEVSLLQTVPTDYGKLVWWNSKHPVQRGMRQHLPQIDTSHASPPRIAVAREELPLTVREAARYLGVSVQTVYLWVERKRIPHLRVMGRNIRFLKSDLEPFRATFKQEVGIGTTE